MNHCFFIPQDWKVDIKTVVGGLTLFYFIFMFPGLVAALQTALVRTNDGNIYQIRFRNRDPRWGSYTISKRLSCILEVVLVP